MEFDEVDYEQPTNLKVMKNIYGKGYELMKLISYSGKECGAREKGIHVPIDPNT
jgi:hypothetical protein